MSKQFDLGDVLTVTTGILVAPKGIGAIYEILAYMTGDSPFTHQLPRFSDECKPHLIRQHPWLGEIGEDTMALIQELKANSDNAKIIVTAWLLGMKGVHGDTLAVEPIPADDHTRKHPYDELVEMRGTDEGIVVVRADDK